MLKKAATWLLTAVCVFSAFFVLSPTLVFAEEYEPYSAAQAMVDKEQYDVAIQNCDTPSLECLVHQIYKFSMIESVNSIVYRGALASPQPTQIPYIDGGSQVAGSSGFVGDVFNLIGAFYEQPPARTSVWVADVLQEMNIAQPAYAQGLGFAALDPVLDLWKLFRNVAYVFFVLIFVIIGFMIMFRTKIGGQSAVTAQQAIPSIIISLILVTFSYAIAGFMIDLMYVIMFMMIGIFGNTVSQQPDIVSWNILDLMSNLFQHSDIVSFQGNIDIITSMISGLADSEAISGIGGVIGGITLTLVLAVAVLIGTFKLFFELLKSYASIVLDVIVAPIFLMRGAIPGNQGVFKEWIRDLAGNLSAFPAVLLMTILYYEFSENAAFQSVDSYGGFMPPFLLGRGQPGAIASLMGLAIILALPEIVKEVKTAVGAKDGIGTKIAGWAAARAGKSLDHAEKGIPLVGGAYAGASDAYRTYRLAKSEGQTNAEARKAAWSGTTINDVKYTGFTDGFSRGADKGMGIRRTIDRIKRNAWMDAEDPTILLRNILDKDKKTGKDNGSPASDRTPVADK
ncbi:MAG: hypothetical protein WAU07_01015 [Microgenomates group bacterium]